MTGTIPPPTKDEVAAAYEKHGSVQGVADQFLVSKTTATKWMRQLNIPIKKRGRTSKIEVPNKREFAKLYRKDRNHQALAKHYGVSVSTIYKWRKALLPEA